MKQKKKVLILLSGCGVFDGSEIHEATLLLLFLNKSGFEVQAVAPDITQQKTVNHTTKREEGTRNTLVESGRIARGNILPLESLLKNPEALEQYDALAMPGGHGVLHTLSNYASFPDSPTIQKDVEKLLFFFLNHNKPIVATCIAPVLVATACSNKGISSKITLGLDNDMKNWLENRGMTAVLASSDQAVVDKEHKIISTPAYMNPVNIADIAVGIEKAVTELSNFL